MEKQIIQLKWQVLGTTVINNILSHLAFAIQLPLLILRRSNGLPSLHVAGNI